MYWFIDWPLSPSFGIMDVAQRNQLIHRLWNYNTINRIAHSFVWFDWLSSTKYPTPKIKITVVCFFCGLPTVCNSCQSSKTSRSDITSQYFRMFSVLYFSKTLSLRPRVSPHASIFSHFTITTLNCYFVNSLFVMEFLFVYCTNTYLKSKKKCKKIKISTPFVWQQKYYNASCTK